MCALCKHLKWFVNFCELLQWTEFGVFEIFCNYAFLGAFAMDKILCVENICLNACF